MRCKARHALDAAITDAAAMAAFASG